MSKFCTAGPGLSLSIRTVCYYEGLPNVIKEAMCCGKAVVAAKTVGIAELVVDGRTGLLVEPGRVDGAAAALEKLLANPELGRQMGGRARSLFKAKRFDWRQTAQAYREVYRRLTDKSLTV
ncbi:glycosyltransferase [Desulfotruncus alcoholivorax]|uniref:glycosyltransferase n=1 Tax=Desulfotruncus alcoholivorax TaxID=265477 RepID=UPI00041AEBAD|nr:glycosyltransferase family 4 protein [Desulfotruncus alcoholivorax]